jgi:hypothetical protein
MVEKVKPEIDDNDDGKKFINIYSKGRTKLGKMLSHFYHSPFEHPTLKHFNSMEGFWHYVGGDVKDERLRTVPGWQAKKIGKDITKSYKADFQKLIMEGNRCKIEANEELKKLFIESTLPFVHYYVADNGWIVKPKAQEWLCHGFETLRNQMRAEAGLAPLFNT